jgi:hypothetical protein
MLSTPSLTAIAASCILGVVLLVPGCNCNKKKSAKKAPAAVHSDAGQASSTTARERPTLPSVKEAKRRSLAKRSMAKVTVAEAVASIPQPQGARVLTKPTEMLGGRQVKSTMCFDDANAQDAVASLRKALEADGWTNIHSRSHPMRPNRIGMAAQKAPYRLTASFQAGNWPGCKFVEKKIWASIIMHKVQAPTPRPDGNR